jgi:hypothetical protein
MTRNYFEAGDVIFADGWKRPEQVKFAILDTDNNWQVITINRFGEVFTYIQEVDILRQVDTFSKIVVHNWYGARFFDMANDKCEG